MLGRSMPFCFRKMIFVAVLACAATAQAQSFTPYKIPLYIFNSSTSGGTEYKVGIRVKVDSVTNGTETPWRMYEFDTGGTGFFAFPFSGTGNTAGDYAINYASGNSFLGNASNTTVTFEDMAGHPAYQITTNIGLITSASGSSASLNDWYHKLPHSPPLETHFYGDFGMALSGTQATVNPSSNPTLYAVIPQLSGTANTGFIIHLGHRPDPDGPTGEYGELSRGWIQVGLDANEQDPLAWENTVSMVNPSGTTFPNSNQPVYTEILSNGTLHLEGVDPQPTGIVYDTGAPNTEVHPVGSTSPELAQEIADAVDTHGNSLLLVGNPKMDGHGSTILDYVIDSKPGKDKVGISDQNVIESPGLYVNTGITAFFDKEVAFNLEGGFIGFKQIPEPSALGLFGISALALGWMARRRQKS